MAMEIEPHDSRRTEVGVLQSAGEDVQSAILPVLDGRPVRDVLPIPTARSFVTAGLHKDPDNAG